MDRRTFLETLAGGLLAAPLVAEAQEAQVLGADPFAADGAGRPLTPPRKHMPTEAS